MIRAARSLLPEVGLALGLFVALNVAGELLRPGFDQTGAWIDLPPGTASLVFEAALAGLLVRHTAAPLGRGWREAGVFADK